MGASQIIYIRTDGNSTIAAGHIMRCLTIARKITEQRIPVCFLLSDTESISILSSAEPATKPVTDFELLSNTNLEAAIYYIQLKTAAFNNLNQELPEILSILEQSPGTLLLDSYFVTSKYLSELRTVTKIAYMDDIMAFNYPVDLLVNYDCFTNDMCEEYKKEIYKNIPNILLGAEYAPLRSTFEQNKIRINSTVKHILITTGSSDPYHFLLQFCNRLVDDITLSDYQFHLVIGNLNTDESALTTLSTGVSNIHLYRGLTDLTSLMLDCDMAITAGGTTLYELCALGIPTFSFSMADNQLSNTTILDSLDIVPYGGDIRADITRVLDKSIHFIHDYSSDFTKRKTAHSKMSSLITGDGATKIANAILKL